MQEVQLNPEKITHPFQLMAAWFAMLIILVGVLLTAAARIQNPTWVTGFLVISCVGLSILVMVAVFVMLTRFRPHLQGPKEYAEWVKDERRYRIQTIQSVEFRESQAVPTEMLPSETRYIVVRDRQVSDVAKYKVNISNLERAPELVKTLRGLGLKARIYRQEDGPPGNRRYRDKSDLAAIWIGSKISPQVAVRAIKAAVKIWPHLCYMAISGDRDEGPPDFVHYELFFGGATSTAITDGLKRWTAHEIDAIPDELASEDFRRLIRAKYSRPPDSTSS